MARARSRGSRRTRDNPSSRLTAFRSVGLERGPNSGCHPARRPSSVDAEDTVATEPLRLRERSRGGLVLRAIGPCGLGQQQRDQPELRCRHALFRHAGQLAEP